MDTLVSVVMGSRSEWQTMKHVANTLASMAVGHEVRIVSTREKSVQIAKYAKSAEERGIKIIVASTSNTADLPGKLASRTDIPILTVPLGTDAMKVKSASPQKKPMTGGESTGTTVTDHSSAVVTALLAASMLANEHILIRKALDDYCSNKTIPATRSLNYSVAV